jgi:DNA polymerase-1
MLVGSGPGEPDVKNGTRFSGFTGKRLMRQLGKAGILLEHCWIDDVVQCHVPATRKPTKTAIRCCRPMLERAMAACQPHTIITLGTSALEAFYPGGKIAVYHGQKIQADGYVLVPMYQPNAYDDNPDLLRVIAQDYAGLKTRPTLKTADGTYSLARKAGWPTISNDRFSIDTETTGLDLRSELLGMSYSDNPGTGQYVEARLLRHVDRVPDHAVMHNAKFDLGILDSNGVVPIHGWNDVDDTMLLAYCMNRKPLGLKSLAAQELHIEMTKFKDIAEDESLEGVDPSVVKDYAAADADMTLTLWEHLSKTATARERRLYETVEKPLPRIMAQSLLNGVHVNVPYFEKMSVDLGAWLDLQLDAMRKLDGCHGLELEVLTSPTQLAKFLSTLLKRHVPNTEKFALEKLERLHPMMPLLIEFRSKYKLKTAFVDSILKLQRDGLVFPDFNQVGTSTGRWSCSGPNMQQLPKRNDKTIREGFVAPPGMVVASLDNSQIDLRSLAYLSQDAELCRIFAEGRDAHSETAELLKGESTELARRVAKTANFLTVFGGGEAALASKAKISIELAHSFLEAHRQKHPGIYEWVEQTHRSLQDTGYVETAYGRRRYIPKVYTRERGAALREGQNMPVQGTSGDALKLQLAAVADVCVPFSQVHDELDFYVPRGRAGLEMVRELKARMEGIECPFALKVEAAVGPNLGHMEKVK